MSSKMPLFILVLCLCLHVPGVLGQLRAQAFGMGIDGSFVSIAADGNATALSAPLGNVFTGQPSTIDRERGIYYLLSFNQTSSKNILAGFDLLTGKTVSSCPAPFFQQAWPPIGGEILIWMSDSEAPASRPKGSLLAAGLSQVGGPYQVGWLDASTCAFQSSTSIPEQYQGFWMGSYTYASNGHTLYATFLDANQSTALVAVNMSSGLVSARPSQFACGASLDSLDFDPSTGFIYGVGVSDGPGDQIVLVRYDPKIPNNLTIVSRPSLDIDSTVGNVATLDVASRELWWLGLNTNNTNSTQVTLVVQRVDDGAVASASLVCDLCDTFPAQMRFFNPSSELRRSRQFYV